MERNTHQIRSNQSLSFVRLFATPWTVAYQASQSMEFSRQDYWSGLPFRIDWLDLLAVQGIVKSLFQHHSSKASVEYLCVHRYDKEPKGT